MDYVVVFLIAALVGFFGGVFLSGRISAAIQALEKTVHDRFLALEAAIAALKKV
jgi:hypothetical protein